MYFGPKEKKGGRYFMPLCLAQRKLHVIEEWIRIILLFDRIYPVKSNGTGRIFRIFLFLVIFRLASPKRLLNCDGGKKMTKPNPPSGGRNNL
jgi:hypothetical protein